MVYKAPHYMTPAYSPVSPPTKLPIISYASATLIFISPLEYVMFSLNARTPHMLHANFQNASISSPG